MSAKWCETQRHLMDTTHLFDCLRSLSKFVYVRTRDELELIKAIYDAMPPHAEFIWVFNAGFGGLCKIEDYLKDGFGPSLNPPNSTGLIASHEAFLGTFKQIFSQDPRENLHFYVVLDAEVWCADPLSQRLILNQSDQLVRADDRLIKSFIFVSRTQDQIPEKLVDLFEVIEEDPSRGILEQVEKSFRNLHWSPPPPDEVCLEIFKGMTRYQIDATIIRSYLAINRPVKRLGNDGQTAMILDAVAKIIGFKEPNLLQATN